MNRLLIICVVVAGAGFPALAWRAATKVRGTAESDRAQAGARKLEVRALGSSRPEVTAVAIGTAAVAALRQPVEKRLDAVAAVLIASADDAEASTRLARWFCEHDATFIREHGATLITVLGANGNFRAAAAFAELGGPERAAWMRLAFARWAQAEPAAARQAAHAVGDDDAIAAVAAATGRIATN